MIYCCCCRSRSIDRRQRLASTRAKLILIAAIVKAQARLRYKPLELTRFQLVHIHDAAREC